MDYFAIEGGIPLKGEVFVSGAKNAVLPIMTAAIMGNTPSVIDNVPNVADVRSMIGVLNYLGVKTEFNKNTLLIDPSQINKYEAPYDFVRKMRASYYVLGPLIAMAGKCKLSLPGGCAIGARPIDLHIKGFEALGAEIEINHGYIDAKVPSILKGTKMFLSKGKKGSSVGATINVMMAAVLAEGETQIEGAACEPEVEDVAGFLRSMGADIEGDGTPVIKIRGVKELRGSHYSVIPDRIEAATYIIAGIMTKGDVTVKKCIPKHLESITNILKDIKINMDIGYDYIRVYDNDKWYGTSITIEPYPGFPTDMQAQMMALLTQAIPGVSTIKETIFENRFMHVPELIRMGAKIEVDGGMATIHGNMPLSGANVMASDLRASAALVLAGLVAEGKTKVLRIYHIDRGYEKVEHKLKQLGARIERLREE